MDSKTLHAATYNSQTEDFDFVYISSNDSSFHNQNLD